MALFIWLLSLSAMSSRFIHVVESVSTYRLSLMNMSVCGWALLYLCTHHRLGDHMCTGFCVAVSSLPLGGSIHRSGMAELLW